MKRTPLKKGGRYVIFTVMILGAFLLFGCGDDGDRGPAGPPGPPGPPGDPGTSVSAATAETCSICHAQGDIADIAVAHPDDPAPTGSEVTISNITLTNTGGVPVVSFHLEEALSGDPVVLTDTPPDDLAVDKFRFMMADLVPAGTPTDSWGTWDSPYWERWVYERTPGSTGYPQGTLDLTDAANGNYTYTFATAFGSPAALADAPDYDPTHVQRLFIRFDGREDDNIPPVILADGASVTQRTVGFLDFNVPADGATAVALDPQRQFVTAETCEQCHSPNWERAAHAGGYRDTRTCVICHSPLGFDNLQTDPEEVNRGQFMQDTDAYASVFFHKIHGAVDIPFWSNRIGGLGYSAVTYPQDISDCVVCHTDSGLDLGTQAIFIDNWKNNPTAEICGSCHDNVNFETGENHEGGAQLTNEGCTFCHPASGGGIGKDITAAHDTTATGPDVPEFEVNITIDPPVNGTHYVEGEAPKVLVTLVKTSDGLPVDPAVYTALQDAEGSVGGGLALASLYVYGPRAKAVPVLTTGSTTDPNFDPEGGANPQQAHALFAGGTDPRVSSSAAGFSYQLLPITADMEPGTYMVRFEGGDYDTPSGTDDDYVTHSTALINFQVGTDVEEFKVAGDACLNCHGDTRMHLQGAHPHNAAFDTDECLGCHDQSGVPGNFGVPIANRVHAVHAANAEGDIYVFSDIYYNGEPEDRPWFEITFPREIDNCNTCHDSGYDPGTNTFEGTYKTLAFMMPCSGCHVGMSNDVQGDLPFVPGVYDHMVQNGGPW